MRNLIKSPRTAQCRTFSLIIILALCIHMLVVMVCFYCAPCRLKLQTIPCKPKKVGILKMLQGALTGVYEMEQPCDKLVMTEALMMAEADDVQVSIVLQTQRAFRPENDDWIRPAAIPLYLQDSSFLC